MIFNITIKKLFLFSGMLASLTLNIPDVYAFELCADASTYTRSNGGDFRIHDGYFEFRVSRTDVINKFPGLNFDDTYDVTKDMAVEAFFQAYERLHKRENLTQELFYSGLESKSSRCLTEIYFGFRSPVEKMSWGSASVETNEAEKLVMEKLKKMGF